jgi:hypothetical protein
VIEMGSYNMNEYLIKVIAKSIIFEYKKINAENSKIELIKEQIGPNSNFAKRFIVTVDEVDKETKIIGLFISSDSASYQAFIASVFETTKNNNDIPKPEYCFLREEYSFKKYNGLFYIFNNLLMANKKYDIADFDDDSLSNIDFNSENLKIIKKRFVCAPEYSNQFSMLKTVDCIEKWQTPPTFLLNYTPQNEKEITDFLSLFSLAEDTQEYCKRLHN